MRTPCGVEHHGAVHVRQLHSLKTDERLAPSPLPPEIGAPTHPGPEILKFRSIVARSKLAIGAQVTRREGPASLMRQFRTRRGKRGGGIDEIRAYRWRPSSSRRQSSRCQGASTRGLAFLRRGNSRGWTRRTSGSSLLSARLPEVRGSGLPGQHFAS